MESELAPSVLILTPIKNATPHLHRYVELIERLDWPRSQLSVGILESDSRDSTPAQLEELRPRLAARAHSVTILRKDFGFQFPKELPRWTPALQLARRLGQRPRLPPPDFPSVRRRRPSDRTPTRQRCGFALLVTPINKFRSDRTVEQQ